MKFSIIAFLALFGAGQVLGVVVEDFARGNASGWTGNIAAEREGTNTYGVVRYDFQGSTGGTEATSPALSALNLSPTHVSVRIKTDAADRFAPTIAILRLVDATGQVFQYKVNAGTPLESKVPSSWKYAILQTNRPDLHWGGAGNGIFQPPLRNIVVRAEVANPADDGFVAFDDIEVHASEPERVVALNAGVLLEAPADVGSLAERLGVHTHFVADDRALDAIRDAGLKWIRRNFSWYAVERTGSGVGSYSFAEVDAITAAAEQRGLGVIALLNEGHPDHTGGYENTPRTAAEQSAAAAFAAAVADHFKGRGIIYEVWNEPDSGWWTGGPNPVEYGNLLSACRASIRTADTGATVLSAGLAFPWWKTYRFWDDLHSQGSLSGANGLGAHFYIWAEDRAPEDRWFDSLVLDGLAVDYLSPGARMWCTEWGISSLWLDENGNGHTASARRKQAAQMVRQALMAWWGDWPVLIWYKMKDGGTSTSDVEENFGLLQNDYTPKPAYHAIRHLTSVAHGRTLAGLEQWSRQPSGFHCARLQGDPGVIIAWVEELNPPVRIQVPVAATVTDMIGEQLPTATENGLRVVEVTAEGGPVYVFLASARASVPVGPTNLIAR